MFEIGKCVVYKKQVCKIKEIKEKYFNDENYYILVPITDNSLTINVPISNPRGYLRELISYDDIDKIIKKIPNIDIIDTNDKLIENEYKRLMHSGTYEDLIKIIKTTYLRNKERIDKNKKVGDKDKYYLEQAEKYLYTEFSVVLNMNYDDTRKYIIEKVEKIV